MEPLLDETRRIARTIRDVIAITAPPAGSIGVRPLPVAEDVADLLVKTLRLEFVYLRPGFGTDAPPASEIVHTIHKRLTEAQIRVTPEALTKVARRANARQVWVEFRQGEDRIGLVIRDDGLGFDLEAARRRAARGESLGLMGIRERVELLGGTVIVRSHPGQGTSIRANFPLASTPWPGDRVRGYE